MEHVYCFVKVSSTETIQIINENYYKMLLDAKEEHNKCMQNKKSHNEELKYYLAIGMPDESKENIDKLVKEIWQEQRIKRKRDIDWLRR